MKLLKNISIVALMALVLFTIAGPMLLFKLRQFEIRNEIKQQIKAGIAKEDLHLVKVSHELQQKSNKVFKRLDKKEFRYQGKMYDIVSQEEHNGETWYYCIADEEEEELFAQLDKLLEQEMGDEREEKDREKYINTLLGLNYLLPASCQNQVNLGKLKHRYSYFFHLNSWLVSPPAEPPKG